MYCISQTETIIECTTLNTGSHLNVKAATETIIASLKSPVHHIKLAQSCDLQPIRLQVGFCLITVFVL